MRVVILNGAGPLFSSGHDWAPGKPIEERQPGPEPAPVGRSSTAAPASGAENRMLQEWHYFFENTLRWRNLRKITIAQVHGTVSTRPA